MSGTVLVKFLPFECRLTLVARRRLSALSTFRQWLYQEEDQNRDLLILDFEAFTGILRDYFNNFMEVEFSNSFYAPFGYVSLTGTDRRRLEFNSNELHGKHEVDRASNSILDETSEALEIVPVRAGNLRKRRGEVYNISKKYDGVAVFTRDGDLPIPSTNVLQSLQLQAHADEYNELLYMLRSASPDTGLDNVASVSLSVDVNYGNPGSNTTPAPQNTDYDFIIIVAVIVAGCSMVLLAFALFLAFRRKSQHRPRPMVQTKLSPRTETDRSPTSRERSTPPPVQVMEVHHQHDDNISEYTESVFSLPAQTKQWKIKESLNAASKTKHHRVSSRFNPRYIISSKKSSDGASQESNNDDEVSVEIPHMASSEEKIESLENNIVSEKSKPVVSQKSPKRSGLYPADIIDDDITSSLSAYAKGVGIKNQYQNDDGLSLSSVESYGFSLDGVGGDQSTYANSTKYGY